MAFAEASGGGKFSVTANTNVTIATGNALGPIIIKNLVICNIEAGVTHTVIIEFLKSGTAYRMFKITLAPDDSLVQDFLLVLGDANSTLRARLLENAAAGSEPTFVVTYAQHSP